MEQKGEILIYQTPKGDTKIDVLIENETVWLTQEQIATLFQRDRSVITKHINNVFEEGELDEQSNVQKMHIAKSDKPIKLYNLDVVISIGYRVKSHVGTHFRKWATQRLRDYIIKGFALDDERLKQARNNYFDELLQRIRDIRSSEKVFYRKVCDIFATSIDYDNQTPLAQQFFASIQNKFHWAIHAHTAAEIIVERANADKPNMGLTNWTGESIKKQDVTIAKNYLTDVELDKLNRIVNQYLEFAELQAMEHKTMHMSNWMTKLNAFLTLNDREILNHAGKISHQDAEQHALKEYDKYKSLLNTTDIDELDKSIKRLKGEWACGSLHQILRGSPLAFLVMLKFFALLNAVKESVWVIQILSLRSEWQKNMQQILTRPLFLFKF